MKNKNLRLVYSSDPSESEICKTCKESPCECQKVQNFTPEETTLKIRLETKGRGGKAVTVIFQLPFDPQYFTALTKKIKNHCGSGGTYKGETIEIQGDHRPKIKNYLEKLGFPVKLAGG